MEILNCIGSLSKFHTRFKVAPQHHFWCSFSVFRFLPICNRTIMAKLLYFLSILSLAASVTSQTCPLQFDGRVPNAATLASLLIPVQVCLDQAMYLVKVRICTRHIGEEADEYRLEMERNSSIPFRHFFTCKPLNPPTSQSTLIIFPSSMQTAPKKSKYESSSPAPPPLLSFRTSPSPSATPPSSIPKPDSAGPSSYPPLTLEPTPPLPE
jgi:hypothetical protein